MRTSARDRPELELVIERPSRALRRARLPERQPPDGPGRSPAGSAGPCILAGGGAKRCRTQCVVARVYAGSRPAQDPSRHTFVWQVWELVRVACSPRTRPAAREGRVDDGRPFDANGRPAAPAKDPQPIREGVDVARKFDANGRRLLLGKGPVSRFLKCVQKSTGSGHRVGSGRSVSQATPAPPTETSGHDSRSDTGSGAAGRPVKQGHPVFQKRLPR